jgi:hypothetical protein
LKLAKAGEFPCRVIRCGNRYRVPRAGILAALHIADPFADSREPNPAA